MIQRWMVVRATRRLSFLILLALLVLPGPAAADEPIRPDLWVTDGDVHATVVSGETLYIGGEFDRVGPNTGHGVLLDATNGLIQEPFPRVASDVAAVVPDGSGGWYIGGSFHRVGGVARNRIAHILPDSTVDPAFNPNADDAVEALALSPDGSILYAAGYFKHIGGQDRNHIAALDAATGNATAWDPDAGDEVRVLAANNDMVFAAGQFSNIGGQARHRFAALDAATGNAAWDPQANQEVTALELTADGSLLYVGGYFSSIGGQVRDQFAALNAATGVPTVWNPGGLGEIDALVLSPGESIIYVGGDFVGTIGGKTRDYIAALETGSNNATDWNPDADWPVNALAVTADGNTIYAGGQFSHIGGADRNCIAALDANTDTNNATAWDPNAEDTVWALAVNNGTVYAGGDFGSMNMVTRNHIAALDLATGQATDWDPDADDDVHALAVYGGTVYAGGEFASIGGQLRDYIAALDASVNTNNATAWDPGADGWIYALALSLDGATVYAGGEFDTIGIQTRHYIAAIDAGTGNPTPWDPDADDEIHALELSGDGSTIYAGGEFDTIGGQTRHNIAALDAGTGNATAWDPNAENSVHALAASNGIVYAAGEFDAIGGQIRYNLAALDAASGLATDWDPNPDDVVLVLALSEDGGTVYAGGEFETAGWPVRNHLAALDATTGLATGWDPNARDQVFALALSEDGTTVYAGGEFDRMGGECAHNLAGILLPGEIIIEKETNPGGGSGFLFSQDVDDTGDFSLGDGQSKTFADVAPGQYTISEAKPGETPGHYDLTDLVCADSDEQGVASTTDLEGRTATVNLDPGETVTCRFTNTKRGKIVVAKRTEPSGDPSSFTFTGEIHTSLKDGESEGLRVRPGTYIIQETIPQGWDLSAISCSDKNSSGNLRTATATYEVSPGEEVICTFTNLKRSKITVEKQTFPDGAEQAFTFSGEINVQLKDGQSSSKLVSPGTYQVAEAVPTDWESYLIVCDNAASSGDPATAMATFDVGPGEHVTCTFGNVHKDVPVLPATMIVAKETMPSGALASFTFQGDAAGTIGDGQRIVVAGLEPGTYHSWELVPLGWRLYGIECDDIDSTGDVEAATATFLLQAGETVTCTFTNLMQPYPLHLPLLLR